jgi:type IV pilus assembly protein PilM
MDFRIGVVCIVFDFLKKRVFPTGVDLGSGYLKMAQLGFDGHQYFLHAAGREEMPADIEPGSAHWQRWVAATAKEMIGRGGFSGRRVVTAMPADDVFIDQISIPKTTDDKIEQAVLATIKSKVPFDPTGAMVKYVVADRRCRNGQMDVLVMAGEKQTVERQLAIYEKANLQICGMSVWPLAMTNSYVKLFSRRAEDREVVVMLVDIGANHTSIVVCKHSNLLLARMIPIGFKKLGYDGMTQRLMDEMNACCRYFELFSESFQIHRLVLISGRSVDRGICERVAEVAKQMQIPAQIGDVLGAVQVQPGCRFDIERRGQQIDWATAFGLSLPEI